MTERKPLPAPVLDLLQPREREIFVLYAQRITDEFYDAVALGQDDLIVYVHHPQGTVSALDRATAARALVSSWEGHLDLPAALSESATTETLFGFWLLVRDDENDQWSAVALGWPRAKGGSA